MAGKINVLKSLWVINIYSDTWSHVWYTMCSGKIMVALKNGLARLSSGCSQTTASSHASLGRLPAAHFRCPRELTLSLCAHPWPCPWLRGLCSICCTSGSFFSWGACMQTCYAPNFRLECEYSAHKMPVENRTGRWIVWGLIFLFWGWASAL